MRLLPLEPRLDIWSLSVPVDFTFSGARILRSHHVLVRLSREDEVGWGAAPLYARPPHALPRIRRELLDALPAALSLQPVEARTLVGDHLHHVPDILSAVDGALWDLEGRSAGVSVAELLGGELGPVAVTEQLFFQDVLRSLDELRAIRAHGARAVKVKVVGDPDRDVRWVSSLRAAVGESCAIRVDANRGYSFADALQVAPRLADLGIEVWEEPTNGSLAELAELRRRSALRVLLDERVRTISDLEAALEADAIDLLNIKLGRIGGITAAARYRELCDRHSVGIVIGCAEDIGPAMAAIVHAAAAWRPVATEGVGAFRLGLDVARPVPVVADGYVRPSVGAGWGLDVLPEIIPLNASSSLRADLRHEHEWNAGFHIRSHVWEGLRRIASVPLRMRRIGGGMR